jgi:hypothetical protein
MEARRRVVAGSVGLQHVVFSVPECRLLLLRHRAVANCPSSGHIAGQSLISRRRP